MEYLRDFFSSDFMPHGHCYYWRPEIVWTNAFSDGIIALAYLTIPFTLVYIVRVRKDINFMSLLFLFATFILGCGATHVMDVINIWKPFYHFDSFLRVITAIASIGTAIMLIKITPKIIVIPNPELFKELNDSLKLKLAQLEEQEKLLRERESLLIETQRIAKIGSYALDIKTASYRWTPEMFEIFEFETTEEITKEKIYNRVHPDDRNKLADAVKRAYSCQEQIDLDYRLLLPDGTVKYIWSKGLVEFDDSGKPIRVVGTVMDKSERAYANARLKAVQSELTEIKEFVFLAESVPQLVWTASADGKVEYFNEKFYEYTGETREDMTIWGWTRVVHPEDVERTVGVWTKALTNKDFYQVEYRLKRSDGEYRWFLGKGTPMKDESGQVLKWFGTCTDIDDIKQAEEELRRKNLELSKTNRDLDNFVYTASHDLKAPVANLEGLLTVHRKKVGNKLSEDELKILDLMDSSVFRFRNTINELTEISRIGKNLEDDIELVFFNETLEDVKADLLSEFQRSNAIVYKSLRVPDVYFSRRNFKSIIYNVVSNAIKYQRPGLQPEIYFSTYKEGNFTVLSIKDNGIGFDVTKTDIIFSMFRRLHHHVEGSGVGLYIVKRILEDAGGRIEVESEIGKGSIFKLYFL
jgi:PAS domain S-box-containing protein